MDDRVPPRATGRSSVRHLDRTGELAVIELTPADWARCADLIETYTDPGLGLVDASVIAIAERLGVTTIATMNHRDFAVVRPSHCPVFELIS